MLSFKKKDASLDELTVLLDYLGRLSDLFIYRVYGVVLFVPSPQPVSVWADGSLRESSWLRPRDSDRLQGQQPQPDRETLHSAQLVPRVSMP